METEAKGREVQPLDWPEVVFFGTPSFAVPTLEKLVASGVPIKLVVSQPDRPSGRGKKLTFPPVKIAAERLALPVYQPERIKGEAIFEVFARFGGDCAVVVAYGQILPHRLLESYSLGVLNVHASLLPRYRGAAPIQRALLSGEQMTGISIMLLDAGMDTGPVIAQKEVAIPDSETFGDLHDRLAEVGADFMLETLAAWKAGLVSPQAQDDSLATYAPPISKDELRIQWLQPASQIVNRIRAFDPVPGAYAFLGGRRIKCFRATLDPLKGDGEAGSVLGCGEAGLVVLAGDGMTLNIGEVQLEGQRRLATCDFVRGRPIEPDTILE